MLCLFFSAFWFAFFGGNALKVFASESLDHGENIPFISYFLLHDDYWKQNLMIHDNVTVLNTTELSVYDLYVSRNETCLPIHPLFKTKEGMFTVGENGVCHGHTLWNVPISEVGSRKDRKKHLLDFVFDIREIEYDQELSHLQSRVRNYGALNSQNVCHLYHFIGHNLDIDSFFLPVLTPMVDLCPMCEKQILEMEADLSAYNTNIDMEFIFQYRFFEFLTNFAINHATEESKIHRFSFLINLMLRFSESDNDRAFTSGALDFFCERLIGMDPPRTSVVWPQKLYQDVENLMFTLNSTSYIPLNFLSFAASFEA